MGKICPCQIHQRIQFDFGDGSGRHGENTGPHKEPTDPDFQGPASESPHKLTQNELNDLVRDLELSKIKAELLASRMKQWNGYG